MNINYTTEKNALILLSLLKQHGVKKVIASPGTTNVSFVACVQNDPFFEVFSAVDERGASFMACGLAMESGEPVVLTCTGATASRNYIPGLAEAYKEHLPILAVTATQHIGRVGNNVPQVIDRSIPLTNTVKKSFHLPTVLSAEDEKSTVTQVNDALLELTHGESGPVHINLATVYSNDFSVSPLPSYRKISRIQKNDEFPAIADNCKLGIFIGDHSPFDSETEQLIDLFCERHNGVVLCDQTSNYRGKYRVLWSLLFPTFRFQFDLIIDLGYISAAFMGHSAREIWRVNPDGVIRDNSYKLTKVFEMEEKDFFAKYVDGGKKDDSLLNRFLQVRQIILSKMPELPFSNIWIASQTADKLPQNSVLHLGILNTIRSYNFFETPATVMGYSNTGGFGIDGCVSSFIGAALVNPDKEFYGIVGDLAFFYDQNAVLDHLPKNVHLMLINNGVGTEFKNYNHRCAYFGDDADKYMAAKGHNGFKSSSLVKNLADNLGVCYLSASNKEEYLKVMDGWLTSGNGPVILEVFTDDKDESQALRSIKDIAIDKKTALIKKLSKTFIGKIGKKILLR